MARTRLLKPGFFSNETLSELEPMARLLFAGLWCHADRAGRLEDRPRRIKANIFPYDDCDVDLLLAKLQLKGFISRYCEDDRLYIQIVSFCKHQTPHVKEVASEIPAQKSTGSTLPRQCTAPTQEIASPSVCGLPSPVTSLLSPVDGEVISTVKLDPPTALRASRATRIPEYFIPNEDHYLIAKEQGLNCDMQFQVFRDHFLGAPGQRGVKLDWDATFRKWLRSSYNSGGSNGQQQVGKAAARAIDNRANILAGLGIGPLTGSSGASVPARSPAGGSPRLVGDVQD